jgi:hypothetical protein
MGKFNNFLQKVQFDQGGQDARRSGDADSNYFKSKLERGLVDFLMQKYIDCEIIVYNSTETEKFGIDSEFLQLIFPNFIQIKVNSSGVKVLYGAT